MEENKRRYPRVKIPLNVSLVFSEEGNVYAVTRDISDGGIFLLLDQAVMPEIGHFVKVQVQGMGGGESAPWVRMEVVRTESDGVGLMIID